MKKYLYFAKYYFKNLVSNKFAYITEFISYAAYILVITQLFSYIFKDKVIEGFTVKDLMWYVIIGELILKGFHYSCRIIGNDITNGNIAYNLSKPYNFMKRIIAEHLTTIITVAIITIFSIPLGLIVAGKIEINAVGILLSVLVTLLGLFVLLLINLIVGISALWVGKDISSIWLIVSKMMLVFVFTPIDFLPKTLQSIVKILPTTHVTYTPSQLFVHFSYSNFIQSLGYEIYSIILLLIVCVIMYKKGVKKLNVNSI